MLKWAHYARKLDIGLLCPNMEIRPRAPKNGIFQNYSFLLKVLQISLPTSPQPSPDIKFKSSYARKRDFGLLCPNMKIRPQAPKNGLFQNFSFLWKGLRISLLTSPQPPPDIKFKSSYARKRDYTQIWKFSPMLPKMEFFKKVLFFEKVSRFCLQRALNHPQTLSLSQVMQENVVLAYYAQIWKIGPRFPKMEFFKKISFF